MLEYLLLCSVSNDGSGDDVTLGMVVGILEREKREYIASFEVSFFQHTCPKYISYVVMVTGAGRGFTRED